MNCLGQLKFCRYLCLLVRENFSKECEKAINKQINMELKACHNYLAMVCTIAKNNGFYLKIKFPFCRRIISIAVMLLLQAPLNFLKKPAWKSVNMLKFLWNI